MKIQQRNSPFCIIAFAASLLCAFFTLRTDQASSQEPGQQPSSTEGAPEAGEKFYVEQVKPILTEHCLKCHGSESEELRGSLALTSRAAILTGGDSGSAVDLDSPDESVLLQAVNYEVYEMPPDGKLPQKDIGTLTQWVNLGLPFPKSEEVEIKPKHHSSVPQVNAESKRWWSFQKVERPELPVVKNRGWATNEIDHFILAKLEEVSLNPAPPASRQQLVRRAYYDLVGLPPTPAQVDAFINDDSPNAYENLIDDLLASPHYGEKWGRHWLDLVRYAESNSFERDGTKPFVWRYRDYVIRSFNDDKPYDQFLTEQLAGDEVVNPTAETLIATGYYRLGAWDDEPVDHYQAKYDDLDDIVATTSQTMLGLTVNCARCHDHKIDPIPQKDYYSFVAFFENIRRFGVRSDETVYDASVRAVNDKSFNVNEVEQAAYDKKIDDFEEALSKIEALVKPDFESVEHEEFKHLMNRVPLIQKRVGKQVTKKQFNQYKKKSAELAKLKTTPPGTIQILCVKETGPEPEKSFVRVRGNAAVKGDEVSPAFISVLSPPDPDLTPSANGESTGRRLALAKWITDPANPLPARVMANRLWQFHFGRGIVRSASDFGFQGTPPTHPELLDWLAERFVHSDWSIKSMHRTIMLSSAYRMSSQFSEAGYEVDPANDRFWRFDLRRLTAEEIRDSILSVNGRLNRETMFGPSIFPNLPEEVLAGQSRPGDGWGKSSEDDRRRRSIYIHVKRSLGVPILQTNDSADTDNTCPVRFITTQPTQALGMMNSAFTNQQAQLFAADVEKMHSGINEQVAEILNRVTQRTPTTDEIKRGVQLIQSLQEENVTAKQALEYFCLMAISMNEFVYVD